MKPQKIIEGQIIQDDNRFSLKELCMVCDTSADYILELIDYGVLEPYGSDPIYWEFSVTDVFKCKRAVRLRADFDINLPGLALSLELLQELDQLREKVAQLEQRLLLFQKVIP